MMKKGKIHIGTSGWHYAHWKKIFYPEDVKDRDQFAFYARSFDTVEINNSFYRLPEGKTFTGWKNNSPKDFLFAVKVSRFITHMKKLNVDKRGVNKFYNRAMKLGEKAGPFLFQLPPHWKINVKRLDELLSRLPGGTRNTFEFREHSWYDPEIYQVLKKYNAAFCIYHLAGHQSPLEVTADFIYIRLHGPGNKYQGNYSASALKKWAKFCREWQLKGKDVFVYFDNDQAAYAVENALQLKKLLR
jgi:uncharacterized protein YecE (DUF72 family)